MTREQLYRRHNEAIARRGAEYFRNAPLAPKAKHVPGPRVDLPGQLELPATAPDPSGLAKRQAAAPMRPPAPQKPCDHGLFSDGGRQLELVEFTQKPYNGVTTMKRYIAYSTASMNALAEGADAVEARRRACHAPGVSDEFLIVAEYEGGEPLEHLDRLPKAARIVWRGSNDLAQRFRT